MMNRILFSILWIAAFLVYEGYSIKTRHQSFLKALGNRSVHPNTDSFAKNLGEAWSEAGVVMTAGLENCADIVAEVVFDHVKSQFESIDKEKIALFLETTTDASDEKFIDLMTNFASGFGKEFFKNMWPKLEKPLMDNVYTVGKKFLPHAENIVAIAARPILYPVAMYNHMFKPFLVSFANRLENIFQVPILDTMFDYPRSEEFTVEKAVIKT